MSAVSHCQYLFNQEAEELFKNQAPAFVNASLEEIMQVVDYLVRTKPDAFFILDPTAFNNQCHLYALFMAQHVSAQRAAEEAFPEGPVQVRQPIDRRFLYHSFFLSYAFLTDPKLIEKVVCKALVEMGHPKPSKAFKTFLKDPGNARTHASRTALNLLFRDHMRAVFASNEHPLYPELAQIAHEDLELAPSSGQGNLYTFPKFAGVTYLLEAMDRERIPLLFKIKVMDRAQGVGSFQIPNCDLSARNPADPVIVFEMIVAGDTLSYLECRDIAKTCPSHSRRNPSSRNRHKPENNCLFCSPKQLDVAPYQQRFQPILEDPHRLFSALGADFVMQNQQPFLTFFNDREHFPKLTQLFEASIPDIQNCHLSMTKPLNMSVSHVYTDSCARAQASQLVIDAAYETHLKERDLT